jgi:hypothetical protein
MNATCGYLGTSRELVLGGGMRRQREFMCEFFAANELGVFAALVGQVAAQTGVVSVRS